MYNSRFFKLGFSRWAATPGTLSSDGQTGGRGFYLIMHLFISCDLFDVCVCAWGANKPWEVSHFVSREISLGMHYKSCLGTSWGPRYDQLSKTCDFRKGLVRGNHGCKTLQIISNGVLKVQNGSCWFTS